jgi:hypothetical protein
LRTAQPIHRATRHDREHRRQNGMCVLGTAFVRWAE